MNSVEYSRIPLHDQSPRRAPSTRTRRVGSWTLFILATFLVVSADAEACTTILIGKGLTADGSVIHAHNEDMGHEAVGRLWSVGPMDPAEDAVLSVPYVELSSVASLGYWASGNTQDAVGLGTAEKARPYDSVLVGMNAKGVSMSCNWAHSREKSRPGEGIRRYAIRQLLLERATSARHGVEILGGLIEKYGQADHSGLIYHLADPQEAWVVETTTFNWVARRVRDDEIHVTANRFRIGSDFDLASPTLVEHAVAKGWLASPDEELNFHRVYGLPGLMDQAYDTEREERAMQLLRGKEGALAVEDLFVVLRDRYEGDARYTPPQQQPVWREDLEKTPSISRTINTNLAQSTFVAHLRDDLPVSVGAVLWFSLAVPGYAEYFPVHAGAVLDAEDLSDAARAWGDGSAWRLLRRLQQAADQDYARVYPQIQALQASRHAVVLDRRRRFESEALAFLEAGEEDRAARLSSAFASAQMDAALHHARVLLQLISPECLTHGINPPD